MPDADPSARRRTALHEAGHACAEVILGGAVEYASIRPGRTFAGIEVPAARDLIDVDGFAPWLPSVTLEPPALRVAVERQIIATLAGELAALYLAPLPARGWYGPDDAAEIARQALVGLGPRIADLVVGHELREQPTDSDEVSAQSLASAFAGPEAGPYYVEWLRCEARELVTRYHAAIRRVADALERSAVLRGDQIAALVHPTQEEPAVPVIRRHRIDPEVLYTCLEGYADKTGLHRIAELLPGTDPAVTAYPEAWAPATLGPDELVALVGERFGPTARFRAVQERPWR